MPKRELERKFRRIRTLLAEVQNEVDQLHESLGVPLDAEETWARRMFAVLDDIASRGGAVDRKDVTAIGRQHGYAARGMAGFYQELLVLDRKRDVARLTAEGKRRLEGLRRRFTIA